MTHRAVVLAAGRGTRLQSPDSTPLSAEQATVAAAGAKAAMPLNGRPLLDYLLSGLADAGFSDICIVVRPDDDLIRPRYERAGLSRLRLGFAYQEVARGTADALLTAEEFAAGDAFVVLNADNYYPVAELTRLRQAAEPATLAFSRAGLLAGGRIEAERLARYAVLTIDDDGFLTDVVEKPDPALVVRDDVRISMNVWRFDARIFDACRGLAPSPRGELELPNAVRRAIREQGLRIRAIPVDAEVLDLSHRADVPLVSERLASVRVSL